MYSIRAYCPLVTDAGSLIIHVESAQYSPIIVQQFSDSMSVCSLHLHCSAHNIHDIHCWNVEAVASPNHKGIQYVNEPYSSSDLVLIVRNFQQRILTMTTLRNCRSKSFQSDSFSRAATVISLFSTMTNGAPSFPQMASPAWVQTTARSYCR